MNNFIKSVIFGVACNFFMTEKARIPQINSELSEESSRQLVPFIFGVAFAVAGLRYRDQKMLGLSVGLLSAVFARYMFNCYDARKEGCQNFKIMGL